jgi:flagellar biosynthesis anti-sigma factor FlgM
MIGPIDGTPIRPDRNEQARKAEERPQPPAQPRRADRVEISSAGQQMAAQLDDVPGLAPERVAEIRQRIADGSYDAPDVIYTVALRMIENGDV